MNKPPEKLGAYAHQKLTERGVEIRVNTKVSAVSPRALELSYGTTIESDTLIPLAPGVRESILSWASAT